MISHNRKWLGIELTFKTEFVLKMVNRVMRRVEVRKFQYNRISTNLVFGFSGEQYEAEYDYNPYEEWDDDDNLESVNLTLQVRKRDGVDLIWLNDHTLLTFHNYEAPNFEGALPYLEKFYEADVRPQATT